MEQEDKISKQTLVAAMIGTVIATVVALELTGKIKHTADKEAFPLAEYRVVLLQDGMEHRLSSQPADQFAYCEKGFLFIQSETDPQLLGPMVDFKNRGIPCVYPQQTGPEPEGCDLPWFLRPQDCR